ncbi:ISL3 family transposase [Corallincola holothuriorum]|uniref:ISL3 family transposase n=1 Tax=Corallincola holothuriorum TaxID=2282215 RepID=A0A368MZN5_9GAMM|nr:ISL3 family transposase [Corallincola holothuriorum]RCU42864.1 ISL3 family transposase [Corallincola holothuriorum]
MDQRTLYERILNLSSPWQVKDVELNEAGSEVRVHVECDKSVVLCCPQCGQPASRYDSRDRSWRHLDTCQFQTLIVAEVPRVHCKEHGCLTVKVPWAEDKSRYTALFEAYVIRWLKVASINAVSKEMKLSWSAIDGIMNRAVQRGLGKRGAVDSRQLAVDEVSFKKGHDYVTVISNHQGYVLGVEDGKSAESLAAYYRKMNFSERFRIQSISMDMSPSFLKATFEHIENARNKIAFDHFHIAQNLNQALHVTRKDEVRQVDMHLRQQIHRTRYYWLRHRGSLEDKQRAQLNELTPHLSNTALVWFFKEKARDIWKGNRVRGAKAAWQEWIGLAKAAAIPALTVVAKQIEERLWGILNAMKHQVSNGRAEAINSKIRTMRVKAQGYRSKERYKRAIMFHFGGLDLAPTHSN